MCQHLVEHGHPDMSSRYLTLRKFLAVADLDKYVAAILTSNLSPMHTYTPPPFFQFIGLVGCESPLNVFKREYTNSLTRSLTHTH